MFRLLLIVLPFFLSGPARSDAPAIEEINSIFAPWSTLATPGCAVGVEENGDLRFARAYGAADLEHDITNDVSTIFEIGSVSKQFAAVAVLLLARDGKLSLTDDVRKHIPELPEYGEPITIDHLLTHTSGLRDWGFLFEVAGWGRTNIVINNADALEIIARQRSLNHRPGDEYSYTNSGYVLAAIIVERISGQSLQEFSAKNIFAKAGMTSTQWRDDFRRVVKGRSIAYMHTDRGYVQTMPFENIYGAGGLLTTITDMLKWNSALSNRLYGEYVTTELERRPLLNNGRISRYARGVRLQQRNGYSEISHSGGTGAYRAWLARFPQQGLSIAVACNAGDPDYTYGGDYFGYKVADLFLPTSTATAKFRPVVNAVTAPGLFASDTTGLPLVLAREDGSLKMAGKPLRSDESGRITLPTGDRVLFEKRDRLRIEFIDGNIETYSRVSPVGSDDIVFDEFTGRFYSDEVDATYIIRNESNGLVINIARRPGMQFPVRSVYSDTFMYDTRLGPNTALVRFERDERGKVNALELGWNKRIRDLRFVRID